MKCSKFLIAYVCFMANVVVQQSAFLKESASNKCLTKHFLDGTVSLRFFDAFKLLYGVSEKNTARIGKKNKFVTVDDFLEELIQRSDGDKSNENGRQSTWCNGRPIGAIYCGKGIASCPPPPENCIEDLFKI